MLVDWKQWATSLRPDEIWAILFFMLFVDGTRYAFCTLCIVLVDLVMAIWDAACFRRRPHQYQHCPSICLLIVGHNDGDAIESSLNSVWGKYPRSEIIVVDDGSTDRMAERARCFAQDHAGVLVLSRPGRGGKSSALNWGLAYTQAEIIVCVDSDTRLSESAIWEIVQPFIDPSVGGVSATVSVRNAFSNLCTWLQAYEYRQTVFMGRMMQARIGTLGIVSGAFGAFRRSVLEQVGGWDVGPGEDGDLVLRILKSRYRIVTASYAESMTNVPTTWQRLFKQRMRWDRTVITFECRKHLDLAFFWFSNFRFSSGVLLFERWFFNIICVFTYWGYGVWLCCHHLLDFLPLAAFLYTCQLSLELVQLLLLLCYSTSPFRDLCIAMVLPLYPFYQAFLKGADAIAIVYEIFCRSSGDDNFVPERVRNATWRW